MFTIYKITSPTGRIYVGKTINFKRRKYAHKNKLKYVGRVQPTLVQESFIKEGFYNHAFDIIVEGEFNVDFASHLERHYIRLYNSSSENNPLGLNISDGGDAGFKCKRYAPISTNNRLKSPESKRRHSEFMKAYMNTEERKKITSATMKRLLKEGRINNRSHLNCGRKYKCLADGREYTLRQISEMEEKADSGIDYHFKTYGHYKNKYQTVEN